MEKKLNSMIDTHRQIEINSAQIREIAALSPKNQELNDQLLKVNELLAEFVAEMAFLYERGELDSETLLQDVLMRLDRLKSQHVFSSANLKKSWKKK